MESCQWSIKCKLCIGNEIICIIEVLKSNLCDLNDAYSLVRGDIVTAVLNNPTLVAFKNCPLFIKCITKIDGTTIDDSDLDLVMLISNLIEYSSNYSQTVGTLWFYSKDEITNFNAGSANNNNFKSFEYKVKLLGNTAADGANGVLTNATIAVPLKYLSNFWRSLNCKIEFKLKWTNYFVLSAAGAANTNSNNIIFTIKDTKLFVPVITFSIKN